MGRYANEARYHEEQIRYYYTNAGENGYKQAVYHLDQLYSLRVRADRSNNSKTDAIIILEIIRSLHEIVTEMKDKMPKQKTR